METKEINKGKIVTNFVDVDSGEVLGTEVETKSEVIVLDNKEAFFMTYLSILGVVDQLDKVCQKVLMYCNMNSEYDENVIHLTKYNIEKMEKNIGLKYQTIKNCITKLKKKEFLFPLGGGSYLINPKYYWKGSSDGRVKCYKYVLELSTKK